MLLTLLATALLVQGTDTTVSVRPGTRLELSSFEGGISVTTWDRAAVRIEAEHDRDTRVDVDQGDGTLSLHGKARYGPAEVTWRLTVPAEMALQLRSQSGDVRIEGTRGSVSVETVEGGIEVHGGRGFVSLQSVEGNLVLTDAAGRVNLATVDGTITVRGAKGDLRASAVDGAILLDDIESHNVEASTVDGDIRLDGTIHEGGEYHLSSHDGDVTVIAPAISATVSVSTYDGDFESDFPVTVGGITAGKRMTFTMGTGTARLELESFDGTVALRRSGARGARSSDAPESPSRP
jgi:Putative adhesin